MPSGDLVVASNGVETSSDAVDGGRPRPLPNLTSLRLFAALQVLLFHLSGEGQSLVAPSIIKQIVAAGFQGVSLFFVLSGFVLAYNYPAVKDKPRFYVLRFARIYPLYFFTYVWMALHALQLTMHRKTVIAIILDPFLLQAWWPPVAWLLNSPAWTLSVEALFYLVFPFVVTRFQRKLRIWIPMFIILWVAWLIPPIIVDYFLNTTVSPVHAASLRNLTMIPPLRLGEFFIGIILGLDFRQHHRRSSGWIVFFATVIVLAFLLLQGHVAYDVSRNGLLALPFGFLVYSLAGWRSPIFGSRLLEYGGEISYGIYLLQLPVIVTVHILYRRFGMGQPAWCISLACTVLAAMLAYEIIEKTGRRLILKLAAVSSHQEPIPRA